MISFHFIQQNPIIHCYWIREYCSRYYVNHHGNIFSLTILSWWGLRWIQSLLQEHRVWDCDTSCTGSQKSRAGHHESTHLDQLIHLPRKLENLQETCTDTGRTCKEHRVLRWWHPLHHSDTSFPIQVIMVKFTTVIYNATLYIIIQNFLTLHHNTKHYDFTS